MSDKILHLQYVFLLLPYRQRKFKGIQHSSSLSKKAKRSSGKAGLLEEHIGEVQTTNTYVAGAGNSLADTDIPERMQVVLSKFLLITDVPISIAIHNVVI